MVGRAKYKEQQQEVVNEANHFKDIIMVSPAAHLFYVKSAVLKPGCQLKKKNWTIRKSKKIKKLKKLFQMSRSVDLS